MPLVVFVPGKTSGVASPRLVELVDLYPTLVELCGLPVPKGLEGTSFVPLLSDPKRPWKKAVFTQVLRERKGSPVMGRSIRTERWRYTEWGGPDVAELYDHDRDPHELHNLAGDGAQRQTLTELQSMLHAGWRGAVP